MKKTKKCRIFIRIMIVLIILFILSEVLWRKLVIRRYTISTNKVQAEVNVMVLTDLHSSKYGKGEKQLIQKIKKCDPDAIMLVGDIVDEDKPYSTAAMLFSVIGQKYPCYYVTGNHEHWSGNASEIKDMIRTYGIKVLEGTSDILDIRGQKIQILGLDDPSASWGGIYSKRPVTNGWISQLTICENVRQEDMYSILLSHRPELVNFYENSQFDLVIAGHSHGGQIRIPGIINGLFAPNQGIFPKYAGGCYQLGDTKMIVSRGLCKNLVPRIFNSPEVLMIHLKPKN